MVVVVVVVVVVVPRTETRTTHSNQTRRQDGGLATTTSAHVPASIRSYFGCLDIRQNLHLVLFESRIGMHITYLITFFECIPCTTHFRQPQQTHHGVPIPISFT